MAELGELEKQQQEFVRRGVRIVVVSNDDQEAARANQADFPHLLVVADTDEKLAKAVEVIHLGAGPKGDTFAPTTFLIDGSGKVRWLFRPDHILERLKPAEVLKAIDDTWPPQ